MYTGFATHVDPDAAWVVGPPSVRDTILLASNIYLRWNRNGSPVKEKIPAPLNFSFTDAAGNPVTLEPYMGMSAHAMIMRDDGSVFIHLHPSGTISMAAQEAFAVRQPTDTIRGMVAKRMREQRDGEHAGHIQDARMVMSAAALTIASNDSVSLTAGDTTGNVRFPYAFPSRGTIECGYKQKLQGKF